MNSINEHLLSRKGHHQIHHDRKVVFYTQDYVRRNRLLESK